MWSLPGGRADKGDIDECATAVREADEELGVAGDAIFVLGRLPDHILWESRFHLAVFLGLVEESVVLNPNPEEVAEVIEFPLSSLLDRGCWSVRQRTLGTAVFTVEEFTFGTAHILGATAGVLVTLGRLLSRMDDPFTNR